MTFICMQKIGPKNNRTFVITLWVKRWIKALQFWRVIALIVGQKLVLEKSKQSPVSVSCAHCYPAKVNARGNSVSFQSFDDDERIASTTWQ